MQTQTYYRKILVISTMKITKSNIENSCFTIKKMTLSIFWILVSCSIFGQDSSKKQLTEADYEKWGKLENGNLSSKGNWISFDMHYDNGRDTLFVMHTQNNKSYNFPGGIQGKFGGEIAFGTFEANELVVTNLETRKRNVFSNVSSFEFANKGKVLITHSHSGDLVLRTEITKALVSIANVVEYQIDDVTNTLSYITKLEGMYSLGSINLKTVQNQVRYSSKNRLFALTVAEYGKGLFLVEVGNNFEETKLHYYKDWESIRTTFNTQAFSNFPKNKGIVTTKSFKISSDGKRVFFGIAKQSKSDTAEKDEVEVWDTEDLWIYPKTKKQNLENYSTLVVWFLEEDRFLEITDKAMPYVQLNGDRTVAMIYNPTAYAPHFKRYGAVDYYLYNLLDGSKKLFLEKQPSENYLVSFSPDGKYICYFKDKNWWLYDIVALMHICIAAPQGAAWASDDLKYITRPHVYGMKGWSDNGESLFLQDEYDVYQYKINSKKLNRLTNGRENNNYFTLDGVSIQHLGNENYNGWALTAINTNINLVIWSRIGKSKAQQYHLVSKNNSLVPLENNISKLDELLSANNEVYVYREQSHSTSPRLVCIKNGIKKILYQSNSHDKQYDQGKVELIAFSNSKGVKLQGLLYYPVHYEIGKTYPLIVNVYSQIANSLHEYCIPKVYNDTGFNIKHFVHHNYFVLLPDVNYYEGETGKSALDCVIEATNTVIETGMVDSTRIGLIGHSFGGYETNYIITKTNKFAAAVSGAAISDIVSWYFSNSKSLNIPELWRSESQQWRIGSSFFEDKNLYLKNSPILFADKVSTPLLSWAGKEETNLPYEQSLLFYNALRRAGKKNVLLLYPKGQHVIVSKKNQLDLSKRISDWFDYYLKK